VDESIHPPVKALIGGWKHSSANETFIRGHLVFQRSTSLKHRPEFVMARRVAPDSAVRPSSIRPRGALHKKSWAVIDRPYSLGFATVGALYERPRYIPCAKPPRGENGPQRAAVVGSRQTFPKTTRYNARFEWTKKKPRKGNSSRL